MAVFLLLDFERLRGFLCVLIGLSNWATYNGQKEFSALLSKNAVPTRNTVRR